MQGKRSKGSEVVLDYIRIQLKRSTCKVVFIDRDILIQTCEILEPTEEALKRLNKVATSLRMLQSLGYKIVVLKNNDVFSDKEYDGSWSHFVNNKFKKLLTSLNTKVDAIYHSSALVMSGMIKEALLTMNANAMTSILMCSSLSDVHSAELCDVTGIVITNGSSEKEEECKICHSLFEGVYDAVMYLKLKREMEWLH